MGQVLKPLGQFLHGDLGFRLTLQLGQLPQYLTATQGTQYRLTGLRGRDRDRGGEDEKE